MGSLVETARALADAASGLAECSDADRVTRLREVLGSLHEQVIRGAAAGDQLPEAELRELADAITASVPVGTEDGLAPRVRVFVRLLRHGALGPAWSLAEENSAGRVLPSTASSTYSGSRRTAVALPLVPVYDGGRVYAWLPGFRDPRWALPDDVYDISDQVGLSATLDSARIVAGRLQLDGYAYLTQLTALADDRLEVSLRREDGAEVRVAAQRSRRAGLVKTTGEDLTRLAWSGWRADVDLDPVLAAGGAWSVALRLERSGLQRSAPLGTRRGPLAQPAMLATPHEFGPCVVRLSSRRRGELVVRVQPLGLVARIVPGQLRAFAHALLRPLRLRRH